MIRLSLIKRIVGLGITVFVASTSLSYASHNILTDNGREVHWGKDGTSNFYMNIVDNTGPNWPVYTAQVTWDQADRLNAGYDSPGTCPSHCVSIDAQQKGFVDDCLGEGSLRGITKLQWTDAPGHAHLLGTSYILINGYCRDRLTDVQRRKVVCHEQGHALALNERTELSTCMKPGRIEDRSATPDVHDFNELDQNIYNRSD